MGNASGLVGNGVNGFGAKAYRRLLGVDAPSILLSLCSPDQFANSINSGLDQEWIPRILSFDRTPLEKAWQQLFQEVETQSAQWGTTISPAADTTLPASDTEQDQELFGAAAAAASDLDIDFQLSALVPTDSMEGEYDPGARTIRVGRALPMRTRAIALLHELGHALTYASGFYAHENPAEVEAQAIAHLVAACKGIHLGQPSVEYVAAQYPANPADAPDVEYLIAGKGRILDAAVVRIAAIEELQGN